ncbi:hypothetical protein LY76DRAFT_610765 [Colletotrichum caudatum]|nr:hypothetical protein LY76DRAFT_610765 [Colletotrichum caudatum]
MSVGQGFSEPSVTVKLREADENPVILEDFIDRRLAEVLVDHETRKALVHADLTTNNLLFDPSTRQVTALLDFDFSYVGTAADEFIGFSFGNICGGTLPGPYESASQLALC